MTAMSFKSFSELKKNLKQDATELPTVRVSVLGECSTQMLTQALSGYAIDYGFQLNLLEADYNQVEILLLNEASEIFESEPQFIILFLSTPKLIAAFQATPVDSRNLFADKTLARIAALEASVLANSQASFIIASYPEFDDSVFGHFGAKVAGSFLYQLRRINLGMMELSQQNAGLSILDINSIQARLSYDRLFDSRLYINADMIYGMDAIPVITKHLADILFSVQGKFTKCIVLDLDNTLWGGVIGDDGVEGIQLGALGIGKAFTEFQRWILQLKERGIILTVCSKNTDEVAREAFEQHPDMVLKLEDFSVFVANWENKVDNIHYIQKVLNISFDAMVFLDDNPFERNMVRSAIPEIQVPELPNDPAAYISFLSAQNLFETSSYLYEDKYKAQQYRAEAERMEVQKAFVSEDDYLASLDMQSEVQEFTKFNIPRVAQLTQRSNQFNLRTVRYNEDDITRIAKSDQYIDMAFTLKDKYGDHGLICVVVLELQGDVAFIDTWLMSCRVLKRGVENFVLNSIVAKAREYNLEFVIGEYLQTPKNAMVTEHYSDLGFSKESDCWHLSVSSYEERQCHISKKLSDTKS